MATMLEFIKRVLHIGQHPQPPQPEAQLEAQLEARLTQAEHENLRTVLAAQITNLNTVQRALDAKYVIGNAVEKMERSHAVSVAEEALIIANGRARVQ
jgi:hypothetical protein